MTFPLYRIDDWPNEKMEYLGTKAKARFANPLDSTRLYLFKEARAKTGEDWSEKIACELAGLMGLPHGHYELASYLKRRGVISPNFLPPSAGLILANEFLKTLIASYGESTRYERKEHTLKVALGTINGLRANRP
jgi:hypothetical protein